MGFSDINPRSRFALHSHYPPFTSVTHLLLLIEIYNTSAFFIDFDIDSIVYINTGWIDISISPSKIRFENRMKQ